MNSDFDKRYLSPKYLLLLLISFLFLISICVSVLITGRCFGLEQMSLAMVCSSAAVLITGLIAFIGLRHNRIISEEPWAASFRDIHREFWSSEDLKTVRKWLCNDESYRNVLLPIIEKRLIGQVSSDEYDALEKIDRYCSIMARVIYIDMKVKAVNKEEQLHAWDILSFMYWLNKLNERPQVKQYVNDHWPNLSDYLKSISKSLDMKHKNFK